jgi:hypothetical protein
MLAAGGSGGEIAIRSRPAAKQSKVKISQNCRMIHNPDEDDMLQRRSRIPPTFDELCWKPVLSYGVLVALCVAKKHHSDDGTKPIYGTALDELLVGDAAKGQGQINRSIRQQAAAIGSTGQKQQQQWAAEGKKQQQAAGGVVSRGNSSSSRQQQ